jgi:hypothetical protein
VSDERHRRAKIFVLSSLLLITALSAAAHASGKDESKTAARTIEGKVYFTNNTPDVYDFPVELFNSKRMRVAAKRTGPRGHFEFKGLKADKYYLQVSIGPRCLLQYAVDARKQQPESLRVFGDADCGKAKIEGLPAPRPVSRDKNR